MRLLTSAVLLWMGGQCFGQAASQPSQRIDITMERNESGAWKAVPPGFVFHKNDHLRFLVRANFDGYLYVMNYGTSGQYSNLFPARRPAPKIASKAARIITFRRPARLSASTGRPDSTWFIG